jgi:hypothetical protein
LRSRGEARGHPEPLECGDVAVGNRAGHGNADVGLTTDGTCAYVACEETVLSRSAGSTPSIYNEEETA